MSFCARGHRVVDSTGECVSVRETAPGEFLPISGDCDRVEQLLQAASAARDWADELAEAWLETRRAPGRSITSCPRDPWTPRQRCAHCLAILLRDGVERRHEKSLLLAAANERAEGYLNLLRDIADDATDGPINPGLNSVQAVLEALRSTPAAPQHRPECPANLFPRSCTCPPCGDTHAHFSEVAQPCPCSCHTSSAPQEPKPLPLGHPFKRYNDKVHRCFHREGQYAPTCGQPESAHQPTEDQD